MQILTTNLHTQQHILFTFQLSNIYHKQCIYIFIILNIIFHAHTLSLIIIHLKLHTYKPCIIYICIALSIMNNSQYCYIYKKNFIFLSFKVIKRVQFFLKLKMFFLPVLNDYIVYNLEKNCIFKLVILDLARTICIHNVYISFYIYIQ